jgi:hypothetical protein
MKSMVLAVFAMAAPLTALAQEAIYPSKFSPELPGNPAVQDALRYIDERFEQQVQEWIRITEIPAKSQQEGRRAEYVQGQLEKLGLEVSVDSIGNVVARRPGTGSGPTSSPADPAPEVVRPSCSPPTWTPCIPWTRT